MTLNARPTSSSVRGRSIAEAVAQLEHAPLAVGEVLERLAQGFVGEDLHGALVGGLSLLVGDQLTELRLPLLTDGRRERDRRLRGAPDRLDLRGLEPRDFSDLVGGRLAAEPGHQLALRPADPG